MRDPAAAAAQRIGRTQYDRITDGVGKFNTVLHIVNDLRGRTRLPDFFHRIFKRLTILRFKNGLSRRTD